MHWDYDSLFSGTKYGLDSRRAEVWNLIASLTGRAINAEYDGNLGVTAGGVSYD